MKYIINFLWIVFTPFWIVGVIWFFIKNSFKNGCIRAEIINNNKNFLN